MSFKQPEKACTSCTSCTDERKCMIVKGNILCTGVNLPCTNPAQPAQVIFGAVRWREPRAVLLCSWAELFHPKVRTWHRARTICPMLFPRGTCWGPRLLDRGSWVVDALLVYRIVSWAFSVRVSWCDDSEPWTVLHGPRSPCARILRQGSKAQIENKVPDW